MSFTDVFENSKIRLKVKIKRGPQKPPKCTFKFEVEDGDAIADKKGTIVGSDATCELQLPACKDIDKSGTLQEFYTVAYKVIDEDDNNQEYAGTETYKVWPKDVKIKLLKDDNGTEKPATGVAYALKQKEPKDDIKATSLGQPATHPRPKPGPITLIPNVNYKVKTWKKGTETAGREREAVLDASFEAAFLSPQSGTKIEQAVNHDTGLNQFGTDGKGPEVVLTVGAKGDAGVADVANRNAIPDAYVFIKCTFKHVSARTDPPRALVSEAPDFVVEELKPSTDKKTFTGKVKIGPDKTAKFKVKLGIGGGDECKIEIGAIKDKWADTIEFQNWRLLQFENWMPKHQDPDKATDYTKFLADGTYGFATATTDYYKKILDKVFIKFTAISNNFIPKANLPATGTHNIVDGAYVEKTAGKKVLVLELDTQAMGSLNSSAAHQGNNRIVSMIWCDLICDAKNWSDSYIVTKPDETVSTGDLRVFPNAVVARNSVAHGGYAITSLKWKISHYKDGANWKVPTAATDPGYAHRNWTDLTAEADIKAHVEFVNYKKIKFKLPNTNNNYPGKNVHVVGTQLMSAASGGKQLALTFLIEGAATEMGFNGAALNGDIWMSTFAGDVHNVGMGAVVLHELGHNMGMAYGNKTIMPTFGYDAANAIPGVAFPAGVPTGVVYEGKDHTGPHCATGLNATARAAASYQVQAAYDQHKCLMFGAASMNWTTEFDFCDQCKKVLLAQDLSNIRKSWS